MKASGMATSSLKGNSPLSPRYCQSRDNCSLGVPSLTGLLHGEAAEVGQETEGLRGRDRVANKASQVRDDSKAAMGREDDKTGQAKAVSKVVQDQAANKADQARADSITVRDQAANKAGQARAGSQAAQGEVANRRLDSYSERSGACHIFRHCRRLFTKALIVPPTPYPGQS